MDIVYAHQEPPARWTKSIFLAGPSPRLPEHPDWRADEALPLLEKLGFDGVVFVPLPAGGVAEWQADAARSADLYDRQVAWEVRCLNLADVIVFWVPRDLTDLPAFTTNVEFGLWAESGKAVLGWPPTAAKMGYIKWHADRLGLAAADSLEETLRRALDALGPGAERSGGERDIPLHIWRTTAFADWYRSLRAAGNRLDGAKVLWNHLGGPEAPEHPFAWALQVDVFVAAENRHKVNEFVLARPDTCAVCAYLPASRFEDTLVVLAREFRSPGRTADQFIRELPGGSAKTPGQALATVAQEEFREEIGLDLPVERFRLVDSRQVAGTFSSHVCHLFAVQLNLDEVSRLQRQSGQPQGNAADSERTYVEIRNVAQMLRSQPKTDWANLGMVWKALDSMPKSVNHEAPAQPTDG